MATAVRANGAIATSNNVPTIIKPEEQTKVVQLWTNDLKQLVKAQNFDLSQKEIEYGSAIIYGLVDKCCKEKIDTKLLNMTNFLEQVKHYSKLELSMQEKEIFIDIRNNSNTGLKDITLTKMYGGIQKIMVKYSKKKIIRFLDDIVCEGDEFAYHTDFNTGLVVIDKHIKKGTERNNYFKFNYAYCIAYVEELGKLVPYVNVIDKTRLMAAYNASPSKEKTIYKFYPERMGRKTAYWCLYNDIFKSFVEIPTSLKVSFEATEDEMNWDNNVPADIDTTKVYDINTEEPKETVVEDTIVVEPAEEKKSEENTQTEIQEENDPDIQVISYYTYYNNKEKYQKVNYEDGRDGYQVSEDGTKTIRVRVKK